MENNIIEIKDINNNTQFINTTMIVRIYPYKEHYYTISFINGDYIFISKETLVKILEVLKLNSKS